MTELQALLALHFSKGLGPRRTEALRAHFGTARAVLEAVQRGGVSALEGVPGLDSRSAASVGEAATLDTSLETATRELKAAEDAGVQVIGRGLDGYPAALEALSDPPAVLWVRGELPLLEVVPRAVGVVGTRKASGHALNLTMSIATELSAAGLVIVSGLARGIDTAAHRAAVTHDGPSIAVVGTGVDVVYPSENAGLARQLCVLSEYRLGTRPAAHHFPMRNRLIAALSAGTLVVEGELTSGALITATHALECGRTVFAVPGRAGDPLASGPHRLLREGAVLAEHAGDILTELGWEAGPATAAPELPDEQRRVWDALAQPATLDDLLALTRLNTGELQLALTMLTLGGHMDEMGGRYVRR